jgi:hypothetical protein
MRFRTAFGLVASLLLPTATNLRAQGTTCSDTISRGMAFLQGHWEGRSYSIAGSDTTLDALMSVHSQPVYGGCVLEERWQAENKGLVLFRAKVLRAYDAQTRRWLVYYVDDQLNSQFYEGQLQDGSWRFIRTRLDNGKPIMVRLTWSRTTGGYDQLIERSRDSGASWIVAGWVTFRPTHSRSARQGK